MSTLPAGKPTLIASIDDPVTQRKFDVAKAKQLLAQAGQEIVDRRFWQNSLFGGLPRLLTTLKPVPVGTDGGVTLVTGAQYWEQARKALAGSGS